MRDQNGVVFPLILIIFLFFMLSMIHLIEIYKSESVFWDEREQSLHLTSLMQMGTNDLIDLINSTKFNGPIEGNYIYPNGSVAYFAYPYQDMVRISMTCRTVMDRRKSIVFVYDKVSQRLVKWRER